MERNEALQAAQKASELEPNLAEAYESLGEIKTMTGDYSEAELAFRKFNELKTNSYLGTAAYPVFLISVGYVRKANEILEASRRNDPLNQSFRGICILTLGILGDTQRAEEEYESGRALFGDPWYWGDDMIMPIRLGASYIVSPDEVRYSDPIYEVAKGHLSSPEEGLTELRRLYTDGGNLSSAGFTFISFWAAYFGDPELAINAMEKSLELNSNHSIFVWLPVMREVRQLPRFKELIKEIGLVDYWNKFGWPDICRPLDNGDFECD